MAYLFPSSPVGALPPEVLRTFRALKALPENWAVWHHLAPWQKDTPDFLVHNERHQALLVKVSPAAAADARPAAQLLLLDDRRPPPGEAEEMTLMRFLAQLLAALGGRLPGADPAGLLPSVVLFPNIPGKQLAMSRPADHPPYPLWLGKEALQEGSLPDWEVLFNGPPLDALTDEHLRRLFTPEVIVPASLTVCSPNPRRLEAGLEGYLLDYDQEAALKADLDLPPEGQAAARDFRLSLVNGVAGSGKTLILLYRLRLLYDLYPGKRFLVLTHNRPLNHDMQARFYRLYGRLPEGIDWHTFTGWCRQHWPAKPAWVAPLGKDRRRSFIRAIWMALFKDGSLSDGMLRSEIDWIKDQVSLDRAAYLAADRRGRAFRLSLEQRERIYQAFERYQTVLKEKRVTDWGDVPRRLWDFIQEGRVEPPQYDVILVDEAQFFAPLWFAILRRLLKPGSGHLFLAADPTQGFLRRGTSWRSLGLDVRGHSQHLKRSYRTTREIFNFATLFYRSRVPQEGAEEEIVPPDLYDMPGGAMPQIIPLESTQDEITRVANEIAAFARQGLPLKDILVLHANWEGAAGLIQALQRKLGRNAAADPKGDYPGNYVRVTTLNAGAGLEAPVVFLAGLHELFEEEQSLRLADEEREEVVRDNTRKIYMAATRASQRLVFTYVGPLPEAIRPLLGV